MKYIADTNVLLDFPEVIKEYDVVIPSHINREIEHLELVRKDDSTLQWEIRELKRVLDENDYKFINMKDYEFTLDDEMSKDYVDNILIQIAVDEGYGMITNDRLLRQKCKEYGIEYIKLEDDSSYVEHKGFRETYISESDYNSLNMFNNKFFDEDGESFELIINEYLAVNNVANDDLLDIFKWDGEKLVSIGRDKRNFEFRTIQFDKFKTKDEYQMMAVDSVFSNQITSIRGRAGSGKSLIALNTAWRLVEEEGYKLIIFTNPVPSKDAQQLGFYKGDLIEKVMQSSLGAMLKSKFGEKEKVLEFIHNGTMDILPFVDLRGYDTGESKVIVWITEAQNLTKELLKLGLQRLGENTKAIIDGDYHQQIDSRIFVTANGMKRMSEVYRGEDVYGEIELQNIYRSKVARIAEKM